LLFLIFDTELHSYICVPASALQDGATALFKASHKGHSGVIEELLKYKPSLGLLPVSSKLVTPESYIYIYIYIKPLEPSKPPST
jgi:hypothetical protein